MSWGCRPGTHQGLTVLHRRLGIVHLTLDAKVDHSPGCWPGTGGCQASHMCEPECCQCPKRGPAVDTEASTLLVLRVGPWTLTPLSIPATQEHTAKGVCAAEGVWEGPADSAQAATGREWRPEARSTSADAVTCSTGLASHTLYTGIGSVTLKLISLLI